MAKAATENAPTANGKKATEYAVLRLTSMDGDPANAWLEIGRSSGQNAKSAVIAFTQEPGDYLAIPVRSMKAITVKVETIQKVSVG